MCVVKQQVPGRTERTGVTKYVDILVAKGFVIVVKPGSTNAVSYTHLDVYKRQVL